MYYILMVVSILLGTINSLVLRQYGFGRQLSKSELFYFNAGTGVVWTACLFLWMIVTGDFVFSPITIIYGAAYGLIIGLFQLFKTSAVNAGPVSITSLIGNYAFVVPIIYSYIVFQEAPTTAQIIGTLVLTVALVLCINPRLGAEKLSKKWAILSFLFFAFGGMLGMFYKVFNSSQVHEQITFMMLIASVVSVIVFFACGKVASTSRDIKFICRRNVIFILAAGMAECIYMRMNFIVSSHIPSALFFPCVNGSMVILVAVGGKVFFNEKHSAFQILGFVLAVVGLIINGCGDILFQLLAQ